MVLAVIVLSAGYNNNDYIKSSTCMICFHLPIVLSGSHHALLTYKKPWGPQGETFLYELMVVESW